MVLFIALRQMTCNLCLTSYAVFEPYDVVLYEKVSLVPDFKRKTLVLIGAQCIGRRQLKSRLVEDEPDKYGEVKACEFLSFRSLVTSICCFCICQLLF